MCSIDGVIDFEQDIWSQNHALLFLRKAGATEQSGIEIITHSVPLHHRLYVIDAAKGIQPMTVQNIYISL